MCKAVAIFALLMLVVVLLRKSWNLEVAEFGFDLPVAAATTPRPTLNATAIDAVLRDNVDATEKSCRMLDLLPQLPRALQAEAAQHLVTFASDAVPENVIEPLLNTEINHRAHSVLMLGLLQRADKIRLPTLLQIARNPEHPKCADALQYLHFILEKDDPADSPVWETNIAARLRAPAG